MSKQCLDIEQMKHLKGLGVDTSNASMYYWIIREGEYEQSMETYIIPTKPASIVLKLYPYRSLDDAAIRSVECLPTFTLQDILDLLPYKTVASYIHIGKKSFSGDIKFYVEYSNFGGYAVSHFRSDNLIDAAYEMLCWVLTNKYIQ